MDQLCGKIQDIHLVLVGARRAWVREEKDTLIGFRLGPVSPFLVSLKLPRGDAREMMGWF